MADLRNFVLTSVLAGMLATAPASAAAPADREARLAELNAAFRDINQGNDLALELGRIDFWAPMTGIARAYGNTIEINPIVLDLFDDRDSARAMAAFLAAYVALPRLERYRGRGPGVAEAVASLGAIAAGSAIDPDKDHNYGKAFDWDDNRHGAVEADELRGARMLTLLEKAHGCSGPLVAVLARASLAKERDPATAQLVYLARKASRDLGKTAYPPDNRCIGGA